MSIPSSSNLSRSRRPYVLVRSQFHLRSSTLCPRPHHTIAIPWWHLRVSPSACTPSAHARLLPLRIARFLGKQPTSPLSLHPSLPFLHDVQHPSFIAFLNASRSQPS